MSGPHLLGGRFRRRAHGGESYPRAQSAVLDRWPILGRLAFVYLLDMRLPRVNAVGLLERPDEFTPPARDYPRWQRWTVLVVLAVFALVTLISTGASLGQYCLTTDGGDVRALPWMNPSPPPSDEGNR